MIAFRAWIDHHGALPRIIGPNFNLGKKHYMTSESRSARGDHKGVEDMEGLRLHVIVTLFAISSHALLTTASEKASARHAEAFFLNEVRVPK